MRSARMDNLKCMLMACVVLGHLLELQEGRLTDCVYLTIYAFHMPLFVWATGYFAKPADQRCLRTLVLPYLVFQMLYSFQSGWDYGMDELKILEPFWLMWFLMALFLWRLILPLVDVHTVRSQAKVLGATFALSLLTGWSHELRFVLSFQRMMALLPLFLLGYYCRQWQEEISAWWDDCGTWRRNLIRLVLGLGVLLAVVLICVNRERLVREWFYFKYPYGDEGGSALMRAGLTLYALVWLGFFLSVMPNRSVPLLTAMGRNTLPVYLLHGFVVKSLEYHGVYERVGQPWLLTLGLWAIMMLAFASPPVGRLIRRCFGYRTPKKTAYD